MSRPVPRFPVPGAELDVELSDEGGHPVVQLHGLTSSRVRDRVLDLDLGRGLSGTRLLRYDARGHGRSTGRAIPQDYRWEVLADDLLRLLDRWFPGEQVHGVGPSMGTGTLLHAALRQPNRFSGLTLLVPPTAWDTRAAKAEDYRRAADLVEKHGVTAYVRAGRLSPVPPATSQQPETTPDVPEHLLPALLRGAALTDLPARPALAGLSMPVHVLAWADDPAHPVSTAEDLVTTLPNCTLDVAHVPADVAQWPERLRENVVRSAAAGGSPNHICQG